MFLYFLACATPSPVPSEAPIPRECVVTWTRDSGRSLLQEQRAMGPAWSDFPTSFASVPAGDSVPAVVTAGLVGAPMVFIPRDGGPPRVDPAAFGPLRVVDVTSLAAGARAEVGVVTAAARGALGERGIVELLVLADVLLTYAHIGSELCLVSEARDSGPSETSAYTARFVGEHTYFTSGRNTGRLAFAVTIAADGAIAVVGE